MLRNHELKSDTPVIYFDNAATSFPKPRSVIDGVVDYITNVGGNPGRSGHRLAVEAGQIVFNARQMVADLAGVANPMHVIFCANATEAINLAILGSYKPGDHVITSSMEHNSTIRPLKHLEIEQKISLSIARCSTQGLLDPEKIKLLIKPETRMVVLNHASNVTGTVQPLRDIGFFCRQRSITFIVDAAQSFGIIPLNMKADGIDLLAFSGHKGLYGPTGTGGLVLADDFYAARLRPLKFGGTGSASDKTEQPAFLPDRFESGTQNVAGLSGLSAGIAHVIAQPDGIEGIYRHKKELTACFLRRATNEIEGFTGCVPSAMIETGVVSFNLEGLDPSHVVQQLDERWSIMSRAGLHCAPLAHATIGTFPRGAIRFSFGIFNTSNEVDTAIEALKTIRGEAP